MEELIAKHDIVISYVPAAIQSPVFKACLKMEKNIVSASFVSSAMKEFHEAVKAKKLIFLNELGVDPGIDHMSSMQVIEQIKAQGAKYQAPLIVTLSHT